MKIRILCTLGISLLLMAQTQADVISDSRHPVQGCVKILNANSFPNVLLIGHVTGMTEELYFVEQGQCLHTSVGSDTTEVFIVDRNNFYAKSGVEAMQTKKFLDDTDLNAYKVTMEVPQKSIWKIDPLITENIEYTVAPSATNGVTLYKSKRISEYNNGKTNNVELFEAPQ